LLRLLVAEIAVGSREQIQPTYRLPSDGAEAPVRAVTGGVGGAGLEPAASCL
jgi:hypothetical protein